MSDIKPNEAFAHTLSELKTTMNAVQNRMEALTAENQRLREVVRLAESELRKRREQLQQLESAMVELQNRQMEAKARVEHVVEEIDGLISETEEDQGGPASRPQ